MSKLKNIFVGLMVIIASSAFAGAAVKGNWTETFNLKDGTVVTHTASDTCVQRSKLTLCGGLGVSAFGLNLHTNSTKKEFIAALKASGLYNG